MKSFFAYFWQKKRKILPKQHYSKLNYYHCRQSAKCENAHMFGLFSIFIALIICVSQTHAQIPEIDPNTGLLQNSQNVPPIIDTNVESTLFNDLSHSKQLDDAETKPTSTTSESIDSTYLNGLFNSDHFLNENYDDTKHSDLLSALGAINIGNWLSDNNKQYNSSEINKRNYEQNETKESIDDATINLILNSTELFHDLLNNSVSNDKLISLYNEEIKNETLNASNISTNNVNEFLNDSNIIRSDNQSFVNPEINSPVNLNTSVDTLNKEQNNSTIGFSQRAPKFHDSEGIDDQGNGISNENGNGENIKQDQNQNGRRKQKIDDSFIAGKDTTHETTANLPLQLEKRCEFENGTFFPNATTCEDKLGEDACQSIFGDDDSRSIICYNAAMENLAQKCAKTCKICCETPKFSCVDSAAGVIDCSKHRTKCYDPAWHTVMMNTCEHTCDFCNVDKCFDSAEGCDTLKPLCEYKLFRRIMRHQCSLTCGLCQPGNSKLVEENKLNHNDQHNSLIDDDSSPQFTLSGELIPKSKQVVNRNGLSSKKEQNGSYRKYTENKGLNKISKRKFNRKAKKNNNDDSHNEDEFLESLKVELKQLLRKERSKKSNSDKTVLQKSDSQNPKISNLENSTGSKSEDINSISNSNDNNDSDSETNYSSIDTNKDDNFSTFSEGNTSESNDENQSSISISGSEEGEKNENNQQNFKERNTNNQKSISLTSKERNRKKPEEIISDDSTSDDSLLDFSNESSLNPSNEYSDESQTSNNENNLHNSQKLNNRNNNKKLVNDSQLNRNELTSRIQLNKNNRRTTTNIKRNQIKPTKRNLLNNQRKLTTSNNKHNANLQLLSNILGHSSVKRNGNVIEILRSGENESKNIEKALTNIFSQIKKSTEANKTSNSNEDEDEESNSNFHQPNEESKNFDSEGSDIISNDKTVADVFNSTFIDDEPQIIVVTGLSNNQQQKESKIITEKPLNNKKQNQQNLLQRKKNQKARHNTIKKISENLKGLLNSDSELRHRKKSSGHRVKRSSILDANTGLQENISNENNQKVYNNNLLEVKEPFQNDQQKLNSFESFMENFESASEDRQQQQQQQQSQNEQNKLQFSQLAPYINVLDDKNDGEHYSDAGFILQGDSFVPKKASIIQSINSTASNFYASPTIPNENRFLENDDETYFDQSINDNSFDEDTEYDNEEENPISNEHSEFKTVKRQNTEPKIESTKHISRGNGIKNEKKNNYRKEPIIDEVNATEEDQEIEEEVQNNVDPLEEYFQQYQPTIQEEYNENTLDSDSKLFLQAGLKPPIVKSNTYYKASVKPDIIKESSGSAEAYEKSLEINHENKKRKFDGVLRDRKGKRFRKSEISIESAIEKIEKEYGTPKNKNELKQNKLDLSSKSISSTADESSILSKEREITQELKEILRDLIQLKQTRYKDLDDRSNEDLRQFLIKQRNRNRSGKQRKSSRRKQNRKVILLRHSDEDEDESEIDESDSIEEFQNRRLSFNKKKKLILLERRPTRIIAPTPRYIVDREPSNGVLYETNSRSSYPRSIIKATDGIAFGPKTPKYAEDGKFASPGAGGPIVLAPRVTPGNLVPTNGNDRRNSLLTTGGFTHVDVGAGFGPIPPELCKDYYPYCEQITPSGFCASGFYPLKMKREFCPQSCGLC